VEAYFFTTKHFSMKEATLQNNSDVARQNLLEYFDTHDVKYVAENGVFRNMSTGEVYTGRAEIGAMLHYMYKVAFEASMERTKFVINDDNALVEGYFVGTHIGEFQGLPATRKKVRAPMCITYSIKDEMINEARIYFATDIMARQLGVTPPKLRSTFLVRDIFQLKFGQFREARKLMQEATEKNMFPESTQMRVLTDFTGDSYRLIMEEGFDSLGEYELSLNSGLKTPDWQGWYDRFKPLVEKSHREILKQIL
jgi:predicted ester cyclase